ncbi:hypothetical protein BKA83DRAFT_4125943 [Pisolithus microcarpus]|nr:hypothetical protein BKA83DRAFT_4125943 [Pisolithus microcarpus]
MLHLLQIQLLLPLHLLMLLFHEASSFPLPAAVPPITASYGVFSCPPAEASKILGAAAPEPDGLPHSPLVGEQQELEAGRRYIPKVHEEDSVEVVLGLVGNGVEEESLEHVGYAQIGEQHHVLAEGMWEGMGGMRLGTAGQGWESREIQGKDPIQVLGYRGIQGKSKGKGHRGERSNPSPRERQKHKVPETKMIGNFSSAVPASKRPQQPADTQS